MSTDRAWQRKVDRLVLQNVRLEQEVDRWQRLVIHAFEAHKDAFTCSTCDALFDEAMKGRADR